MTDRPTPTRRPTWASDRTLAVIALLGAIVYLVWRGVGRALSGSGDLTYGFAAGRAWLEGLDPYDGAVLEAIITDAGGPVVPIAIGHGVYFPPALPMFVPITFGDWEAAKVLWLVMGLVGVAVIAVGAVRLLAWPVAAARSLLLMAFVIGLAPIHTTLAFGQTSIIATAFVMVGVVARREDRPILAGIAFGLATALKVQIGLPFLAYLVWRRGWRSLGVAALVLAILSAISVARMELAGVPWFETWMANLAWLSGPDGNAWPGAPNPDRFSLIHLAYLTHAILPPGRLAELLPLVLVGIAGLVMIWRLRRPTEAGDLLALALVAVLGLLITYHRYYDATVLALPVAWGFLAIHQGERLRGVLVLILTSSFLVPIQTGLHEFERAGWIPDWLTDLVIWDAVFLTAHVWALVLLVPVLLVGSDERTALRRSTAGEAAADQPLL